MGIRKGLEAENRDPSRTPSRLLFLSLYSDSAWVPFCPSLTADWLPLFKSPPQDLATNSSQVCMLHPSCWKG